ncbi:MAG: hypothetical protein CMJ40_03805 [Phycisphaerae bacterium]|nr:hypothetical protein [Phycisphaerae bacterium]
MKRTVQLQHDLPDGSSHVDWMLEWADCQAGQLVSIRLETPLNTLEKGGYLLATRLKDHRAAYLEYEGPVSNDRGHVRRLEQGQILEWVCTGDEWWITLKWSGGPTHRVRVSGDGAAPEIGKACRVYASDQSGSDSDR